jgi:hypothetical protein
MESRSKNTQKGDYLVKEPAGDRKGKSEGGGQNMIKVLYMCI